MKERNRQTITFLLGRNFAVFIVSAVALSWKTVTLNCTGKYVQICTFNISACCHLTVQHAVLSLCLWKKNVFGRTHAYLSGQHLATSQAHRLYTWIHPEQIHSPCKQCKSSSSSLLPSWSPAIQNTSSVLILYQTTKRHTLPPPANT